MTEMTSLILSLLHAEGPLRMEHITVATGYTAAQLRRAMRELIDAGAVTSFGRTRGTTYVVA